MKVKMIEERSMFLKIGFRQREWNVFQATSNKGFSDFSSCSSVKSMRMDWIRFPSFSGAPSGKRWPPGKAICLNPGKDFSYHCRSRCLSTSIFVNKSGRSCQHRLFQGACRVWSHRFRLLSLLGCVIGIRFEQVTILLQYIAQVRIWESPEIKVWLQNTPGLGSCWQRCFVVVGPSLKD